MNEAIDILARLLRQCYIDAYVALNPHHSSPGWDDITQLQQVPYKEVARRLLLTHRVQIALVADDRPPAQRQPRKVLRPSQDPFLPKTDPDAE